MSPDFDHPSEVRAAITSFFTKEKMMGWVDAVRQCDGNHGDLLPHVRQITGHQQFRELEKQCARGGDYLIPDASGGGDDFPRALSQDVIFYARIMAYSRVINHELAEEELDDIYKHHCVEPLINYCHSLHTSSNRTVSQPVPVTEEESVAVLKYYIERVAASTFPD